MIENKKKKNKIEMNVGRSISMSRKMMGISKEKIGENMGIKFKKIKK